MTISLANVKLNADVLWQSLITAFSSTLTLENEGTFY